jgi:hypothetical protein
MIKEGFYKFSYLKIKAFTISIRKNVRMESIWATIQQYSTSQVLVIKNVNLAYRDESCTRMNALWFFYILHVQFIPVFLLTVVEYRLIVGYRMLKRICSNQVRCSFYERRSYQIINKIENKSKIITTFIWIEI